MPESRPRLRGTGNEPPASDRKPGGLWSGGVLNSGVLGGLAAMLVAVVWFVGGLAAGILFYYPPVLFIIGMVAVIKGLFRSS